MRPSKRRSVLEEKSLCSVEIFISDYLLPVSDSYSKVRAILEFFVGNHGGNEEAVRMKEMQDGTSDPFRISRPIMRFIHNFGGHGVQLFREFSKTKHLIKLSFIYLRICKLLCSMTNCKLVVL